MRHLALLLPLLLAACDSVSPGSDGPLALGIVSGNYQVAPAGSEQLPDPVVGRMVRTPSGAIVFHLVTPAYAQGTVVQGSPVAGAVVCAVNTSGELEAFTPCTNTDASGQARFFFAPGTVAGEARAEIRGTLEGEPAVFDTVVALVEPGDVAELRIGGPGIEETIFGEAVDVGELAPGDSVHIRDYIGEIRDAWRNDIAPGALAGIDGSEVTHRWSERRVGGERWDEASGWHAIVPDTVGLRRSNSQGEPLDTPLRLEVLWRGEHIGEVLGVIP